MLSILFYLCLILGLSIWVEGSDNSHTKPLIIKQNTGIELDNWLKNFQWAGRFTGPEKMDLPRYKFYSDIVETLLSFARRMGGAYQDSFLFLRDGLQADLQFEKKMRELSLGCWIQILMIMVLTWAFIIGALSMVQIKVPWSHLVLLLIWQLLGLISLPILLNYFRKKLFADIGKLWKALYILTALAQIPISRSEIFALAGIKELNFIKQKSLEYLVEKLKSTCQHALKQGGTYEQEVKILMEELRFQEKWHFELFEKKLLIVKLSLLSIFFLPAYLSFIFMLLGDLMTLM
jgi:hypothetical protein